MDSEQAGDLLRQALDIKLRELCRVMELEDPPVDLMLGACGHFNKESVRENAGNTFPEQTETKKNLMSRDYMTILFSDPAKISEIEQIIFSDIIIGCASLYYNKDISENGDGSVVGWIQDTTLFIQANGIITAPRNCTGLFADLEQFDSEQKKIMKDLLNSNKTRL